MKISETDNHQLAATWSLEKYTVTNQNNEPILLWGEHTSGLLIYADNGCMSVQVSNNDRPIFAKSDMGAGSVEEITQAFMGYTAYFGKYEYQEKNNYVLHFVEQSVYPNWNGVTHTRYVSLNGNQLILSTPPIVINGEPCEMQMFWQRID